MINLLHHNLKENRLKNRKFSQLLFFFLILLIFSLTIWVSLVVFGIYQKQENVQLDAEIMTVESNIVKHQELEKNITYVNRQLGQIDTVITSRKQWSKIIVELASRTPKQIGLENVNFFADNSTSGNGNITVSGIAKTLEDIEVFQKSLDNSEFFDNSAFQSASFKPDESTFSFNLTTEIIVPGAEK